LSGFHKLLSQNAVTENQQKNYPASQVEMNQMRHIASQDMPTNINKSQAGRKYSQNISQKHAKL